MANAPLRVVEGGSMDKDKALAAALSQIERNFGKGSIMRLGEASSIEVESISTGSLGLDIALGIGGLCWWSIRLRRLRRVPNSRAKWATHCRACRLA